MLRPLALTALAATLLLPACLQLSTSGGSVYERDGNLYLDDVLLGHHRVVELDAADLGVHAIQLECPTGLVDLVGVEGGELELVVDLYTEVEDDGRLVWEGARLRARSQQGRRVLINGIRGRIPADMQVRVDTGTGQVVIADLTGGQDLEVSTGTGPVRISGCEVGLLELDTGTGDLRLEAVQAARLTVDSGTGDLAAQDCHFDSVSGDSGTGDFRFTRCVVGRGRFDSGTGDVRLVDSDVQDMRASLGAGDVVQQQR